MSKYKELLSEILIEQLSDTFEKTIENAVADLKSYIDKVMLEHDTEHLLSVDEASAFLGLPKSTIYKLSCKNELPFYKPGGSSRIFFDRRELAAWARSQRVSSKSEIARKAVEHLKQLKP